jgi:hypothetical protein
VVVLIAGQPVRDGLGESSLAGARLEARQRSGEAA